VRQKKPPQFAATRQVKPQVQTAQLPVRDAQSGDRMNTVSRPRFSPGSGRRGQDGTAQDDPHHQSAQSDAHRHRPRSLWSSSPLRSHRGGVDEPVGGTARRHQCRRWCSAACNREMALGLGSHAERQRARRCEARTSRKQGVEAGDTATTANLTGRFSAEYSTALAAGVVTPSAPEMRVVRACRIHHCRRVR
jgi:hypothetical protein